MIPEKVWIREVGPRDGLQMEKQFIPTEMKVRLINRLLEAGLQKIEVTSFVSPKAVVQLKDAEAVVKSLETKNQVEFSALIINEKGMERAVRAGIGEVVLVVSATEAHNNRNGGQSIAQSLRQMGCLTMMGEREGVRVRGAVAVAFGCPFEGTVPIAAVDCIVAAMSDAGITQITLADTAGMASPVRVRKTMHFLNKKYAGILWGLHFHDTRGLGLANTYAGLEEGVSLFETSIGGLGGCPFIPNAAGNVATEDLVNMLTMMRIKTGVGLTKLLAVAQDVEDMLGRPLPSRMLGLSKNDSKKEFL